MFLKSIAEIMETRDVAAKEANQAMLLRKTAASKKFPGAQIMD